MEDIYVLLLGSKYRELDKYPANVIKIIDLAVKAYEAAKMQDAETLAFVMIELKKFINFAFLSPQKEDLLQAIAAIEKSTTYQGFLENFRGFIKIALKTV